MLCVDRVPVGLHWDGGYCPQSCFGASVKPDGWDANPALAAVEVSGPEIPVEMLTDEERRGLGDVIKDGIEAVGLDVLAKWWERVTGKPCACEQRRVWLNRLASWKK